MYLSKVRIRNFRNFSDVGIELSAGLNVIVGENNIGKTNLLDAVRVALGPAALTGLAPRVTYDDLHVTTAGTRAADVIRIDLTFDGLTVDEQAEFLECLNYNPNSPERSTASVHYEWTWSEKRKRGHHKRWGGDRPNSEAAVPEETLQAVKVILLDALRDAASALAPGRESRLGQLLDTVATDEDRDRIVAIFGDANTKLEADQVLIQPVEKRIGRTLEGASRGLSQKAFIRASDARFERIVEGLRLLVGFTGSASPLVTELRSNGLGYNNLLYIGTVLAELAAAKDATMPMLLVEEPEAHLHPQLQTLLADFLATGAAIDELGSAALHPGAAKAGLSSLTPKVQTIITTHSPTIAAHVPPETIRVLHRDENRSPCCVNLKDCGLSDFEMKRLRRMLDVTKATLLFSRGVVLVEGLTEQLLVPVLAQRLGHRLADHGVSVISLAGVSFSTIAKLFGEGRLRFPVAIVTDGDPEVIYPDPEKPDWKDAAPKVDGSGRVERGPRLQKLLQGFEENSAVRIFGSSVTLEYDLAAAGDGNAEAVLAAWTGLYERGPRSPTPERLRQATTNSDRALELWRAICVGNPSHGKGELAQALAEQLEATHSDGEYVLGAFAVPQYIKDAIDHALSASDPR